MADRTRVKLDLGSLYHDTDKRTDNYGDDEYDDNADIIQDAGTRLSWSHDPPTQKDNMSDWKIIITHGKKDDCAATFQLLLHEENVEDETIVVVQKTTYHVHKCMLGAGPRTSHYFRRLFKSSSMCHHHSILLTESTTSTSHIELQSSSAVAAFPIMLDFMYSLQSCRQVQASTTATTTTTTTAVALRYLANYFEVPTLFQSTNMFIQNDMDQHNIHIYLQEAMLYQDEPIIEATMKVGANAWQEMLLVLDPNDDEEYPVFMELLSRSKQLLRFTKLVAQEASLLLQESKQRELNLARRLEMLGLPPT